MMNKLKTSFYTSEINVTSYEENKYYRVKQKLNVAGIDLGSTLNVKTRKEIETLRQIMT